MRKIIKDKAKYAEQIFATVLLLCFIKVDYFSEHMNLSSMYSWLSILALIVLTLLMMHVKKLGKDVFWLFYLFAYLLILTFIKGGNIVQYVATFASPIGLGLMASYYIRRGKQEIFFNAFIIFEIIIYINCIATFLYPDGMYSTYLYTNNWILGYKNPQIRTIIPVLGISLIRSVEKYSTIKRSCIYLYACAFITMLKVNSSTGILAICLFGILLFIFVAFLKEKPKWFTLKKISLLLLVINIGMIFLNIQTWFNQLFGVLGKDATLTGRITIWRISLQEIANNLLFGKGYLTGIEFVNMYQLIAAYHPHNFLLYILLQGGLVLLGIIIVGIIHCNDELNKNDCISGKISCIAIICLLFIGLNEALTGNNLLYMFLIIGMNARYYKPITCLQEKHLYNKS